MKERFGRLAETLRLWRHAARMVAGRRLWIAPLLPLTWIAFQIFRLLVRWRTEDYTPADAQTAARAPSRQWVGRRS